jgi:hypothetical protein
MCSVDTLPHSSLEPNLETMLKSPLTWATRLSLLGTSTLALLSLAQVLSLLAQPQPPVLLSQADAESYHQRGIAALRAKDWQGVGQLLTFLWRFVEIQEWNGDWHSRTSRRQPRSRQNWN